MEPIFLMGLDVGGSGGRCLLVNAGTGERVVAQRRWTHPAAPGLGSWAFDVDTAMIWRTMGELAHEVIRQAGIRPGQVAGIAATGFRHGTFVIGADGAPLFAVPTRDARAVNEGMTLANERGAEFYTRTGHYPSPLMLAARLRYLQEQRPEILSQAQAVLSTNDWAAYQLSGVVAAEATQAGETMLCDLPRRAWAVDLIDSLELPGKIFPRLVESGERLGELSPAAAAHLGLPAGIPVAACCGDTQSALLGMGVIKPGQYAVIAGSTSPLVFISKDIGLDAGRRTWSGLHAVPGLYMLESNAGQLGAGLEWIAELLYPGNPHAVGALLAEARSTPPGGAGAISSLGGGLFNAAGLSLPVDNLSFSVLHAEGNHRAMLAGAIVEGLAYWLRANLEQLSQVSAAQPGEIWMSGGMARSATWNQALCDVLNMPVYVQPDGEATAVGAAICAGMGAGIFPDFASGIAALVKAPQGFQPEPRRAVLYDDHYRRWDNLRRERADSDLTAASLIVEAIDEGQSIGAAAPRPAADLRPHIFVSADAGQEAIDLLGGLGEVAYESYREGALLGGDDLVEKLRGYQVFVTEIDLVDADVLRKLPELRLIFACRNNPVNVDLRACTAAGVPVINTPGRNAEAVADLTVGFMLALARLLIPAAAFLHEPEGEAGDLGRMGTAYTQFQGHELWGKTVGLVGAGAVGRKVSQRLLPFGARLLVYDPYLSAEAVALLGAEKVELERLLVESDIVSLHATVTDETRGLIDATALARMKPGALLVNTARAALVDEAALIEALQSGRLGGAALDVFSVEPPGADDPLLACPNLIATPHIAGNTHEVGLHQGLIIVEELRRMLNGQAPRYALNPQTLAGFAWSEARQSLDAELVELAKGPGPSVRDLDQIERLAPDDPRRPSGASLPEGQGRDVPLERLPVQAEISHHGDTEKNIQIQKTGGVLTGLRRVWRGKGVGPGTPGEGTTQVETAIKELPAVPKPAPSKVGGGISEQARARFLRILETFLQRMPGDAQVSEFAKGKNVTFLFTLRDLFSDAGAAQEFYMSFIDGAVKTGLDGPPTLPDVRLKMTADTMDGIFTTRVNPTKAAMTGKISFSGDTSKAMAFQKLQGGLQALYQAVRAEIGDPGDLSQMAVVVAVPAAVEGIQVAGSEKSTPVETTPSKSLSMQQNRTGDIRDEILSVTNELYAKGLLTATGGNVSARLESVPGQVWITPSAIFKGNLQADMMVKIDLDGNVLDEGEYGYSASSERRVHTAIYKARPELQAVIHSHAHYATLLAMSGLKFLPITTESAFIGEIPVVPFVMPGTHDLGEAVAQAMGAKGFVAIMQNHGLVVAGSSLRRAADMTEVVETTAHAIITFKMLGVEPPVLPAEVVEQLREMGAMMA